MSASGWRISIERGPWMATRPVARLRSSSTALNPASRSASASDTVLAFEALATTM